MINLEDTEIMNHLNIGIALYRTLWYRQVFALSTATLDFLTRRT